MTDRKQALTNLLEKIKAGKSEDWITYARAIGLRPDDRHIHAWNAFNGSLDAAKALHEAVLGDVHVVRIGFIDGRGVFLLSVGNGAYSDNPALEWLIAIIEALIEEEETQ